MRARGRLTEGATYHPSSSSLDPRSKVKRKRTERELQPRWSFQARAAAGAKESPPPPHGGAGSAHGGGASGAHVRKHCASPLAPALDPPPAALSTEAANGGLSNGPFEMPARSLSNLFAPHVAWPGGSAVSPLPNFRSGGGGETKAAHGCRPPACIRVQFRKEGFAEHTHSV